MFPDIMFNTEHYEEKTLVENESTGAVGGEKDMDNKIDTQVLQLYQAIEDSSYTVAVTGAGISLSAGGITFSQMLPSMGPSIFGKKRNPDRMYKALYKTFLKAGFENGPTVAHKALAKLEEMGKLQGIITTNEDCIHTMAGSKNVAELEGSYQVNTCEDCGYRNYDYEIWNHGHMPTCPKCGGIMLPYDLYSHVGLWEKAVDDARAWISKAQLILVIGTNGYYGSVYWGYRKPDAKIIQINPKKTNFDSEAALNIHQDADTVFGKLMQLEEGDEQDGK